MRILLKILLFPVVLVLTVLVAFCRFFCLFSGLILGILAGLLFLISCGFARRDLFLPQLVSVCHGALRSGVISGINGFWLRSILNPPQRKLISRNSIRSASWYALCAELCLMSLLILEAIPKLIRCKGTDGILG